MKTYLKSVCFFAVLGILCVAGLLAGRYWIAKDLNTADPRQGQLLAFQEMKIRALLPDSIDTVLVGDSTLGNAIDIKTYALQTKSKAVNLALTGSFGYGGALVQLQSLAKRQARLRNVVLFYSVDAMASGLLPDGYFFSTPRPNLDLPWQSTLKLLRTYGVRLLDGPAAKEFLFRTATGRLGTTLPSSLVDDDYIISHTQISFANAELYRVPREPVESSIVLLDQIAKLCRTNGWNCGYVHGPVLSRSFAASPWADEYLSKANRLIQATGLRVIGGPLLMEDDERGDTVFHVRFENRDDFSRKYISAIRLPPSGPAP